MLVDGGLGPTTDIAAIADALPTIPCALSTMALSPVQSELSAPVPTIGPVGAPVGDPPRGSIEIASVSVDVKSAGTAIVDGLS